MAPYKFRIIIIIIIIIMLTVTATNCLSTDFRCADGVQCIRPCARCDGVFDCSDSSDELNCCELPMNSTLRLLLFSFADQM